MDQIIVLLPALWESTQPDMAKVPSKQYSLSVTRIWDSAPDQQDWVYIVASSNASCGGVIACKTPAMMKALLRGLPTGSNLDWHPRTTGELEVLADHLEDMVTICTKGRVVFTVH